MVSSVVRRASFFVVALLLASTALPAVGQQLPYGQENELAIGSDEAFDLWPVDLKINGQVMMAGSAELPEGTVPFFLSRVRRRAGDDPIQIWHVSIGAMEGGPKWPADVNVQAIRFQGGQALDMSGVHGLWLSAGGQRPAAARLPSPEILRELAGPLRDFVEQGGILFTEADTSPWMGAQACHPVGPNAFPQVAAGLGLVPDCVIACPFDSADELPLLSALTISPRSVGVGIPPGGVVVLNGRKMRAYGKPGVLMLAGNTVEPVRRKVLRVASYGQRRINPYLQMIDLTAWRRDAIDRTHPPFPPSNPPKPFVENGSLVIVGGGGMPEGLMEKFVELAGGSEAKLVYIPCAESDEVPVNQRLLDRWLELGAKSAIQLHTKDRVRANSDEDFLEPLRKATGIWYGGGRQWNFSDSYFGTESHRLMKRVVERGGVVGGSSAGASIQARYLARANPLGNFDIMVDGYERGGLGFLRGVAIDQHFTQRRRQKDMSSLVDTFPQLLGIGLDEKTAILVQGSTAEVVGDGRAFFYDREQPVIPGQPDYVALESGERYDLENRSPLAVQTQDESD